MWIVIFIFHKNNTKFYLGIKYVSRWINPYPECSNYNTPNAAIINAHVEHGTTFPISPTIGRIFYLSANITNYNIGLYVYDGTIWQILIKAGSSDITNQASTDPLPYPWTKEELIPICWQQLGEQTTAEENTMTGILANKPLTGQSLIAYPNGYLGLDSDGEQYSPTLCFYEGGSGSPGATPYMFTAFAQLLWEEDSSLNTIYNQYKAQIAWWQNVIVPLAPDPDVCVYNFWEVPKRWADGDSWGLTDKSFYTDTEYYSFPRPRAITESANIISLPTISTPNSLFYLSKPFVYDGTQWIELSNVMVQDSNGDWVETPAGIIKYYSGMDFL